VASSLTIKGLITGIKTKADYANDAPANASVREINIQIDGQPQGGAGIGGLAGGFVSFVSANATEASGIDALFVGSTCTLTVTSP
jgi:hypothetical protein